MKSAITISRFQPQGWLVGLSTALIRLYQVSISKVLGQRCRFAPSCSQYAHDALVKHGPWRGFLLAIRRVARCHPWHPGGWDPVP